VGERLAGTKSIEKAAFYIKNKLEEYGLESRNDRFPMYHSYPVCASLRLISPENRILKAKPVCHILSTPEEGITGELVYAAAGGYKDYETIDVKDKIILTDMTWAPPRPEKARIAFEKEAKALVIMNWGTSDNPVIQMGAVKSVWGNPTPENFKKMPLIPVISILRADGEYLKELCTKGKPHVWLRAEATREWVQANQPTGTILSKVRPDEFILVGGHLEAWGKTAICNSSGNALMLELARVLAKHRDMLKRSIVFAFWDGHEIAEIEKAALLEKTIQSFHAKREEVLSSEISGKIDTIDLINRASMKVSRILSPILWMEAEKHSQDPYGYYLVGKPIPRLYVPITQMKRLTEDQEEFQLWMTKLTRERNLVSDAIQQSLEHLGLVLKLL
jgi:hypothetical protein